jgi:ABC-type sugar transport system ATPase subunit
MRRELHLLHPRLRATIIYVSHDQDEVMSLGDRLAVLDRGVIRQMTARRSCTIIRATASLRSSSAGRL